MSNKRSNIWPGLNVDCVVELCEQKRELDIRKSQVYEYNNKIMIISQTIPPILSSFKGRRIAVTYLNTEKNMRFSVSGKISYIVGDYKLSSTERVNAIVLSDLSEEEEYNLRFAFRVKPPDTYKLVMFNIHKEALRIVDISATGIRFAHTMTREYQIGQIMKMYLGHEQAFYELKGQVVRKVSGKNEKRNTIEHVAVRFIDLDDRVEDELYRIVRNIERQKRLRIAS